MVEDDVVPTMRLAAVMRSLRPAELRVAEVLQSSPELIVESTAQELADRTGIARTSVIRSAQALGYRGYAQFRVAVARQLAADRPSPDPASPGADDELGRLRGEVQRLSRALPGSLGLLSDSLVSDAIAAIIGARTVMCVANGLSGPLAAETAMRLSASGRPAQHHPDALAQQIAAHQLTSSDVMLVISGSGANELTVRVARAGRDAGATIIAVTSFGASPLVALARVPLVVAVVGVSFRDELERTSRVVHVVFLDALLARVVEHLGEAGRSARDGTMAVLADNLTDEARG